MSDSGIYKITCLPTKKIYIGSAVDIAARWASHRSELNRKVHPNIHLQRAWNKYGEASFSFQFVERCPIESLIECEQYYLDALQPFGNRGFNICKIAGSCLGTVQSEETRLKKSVAMKGRAFSEDHKARIGEGNSRREWSEESRAKISAAQKGRKHPDCSEATRKKIGDAHRGKTLSPEQIEILKRPKSESHRRKLSESSPNIQSWIVTPFGGEPMKIENLANFCRENNLGKANMLKVSQGKAKSCKGWTCEKAMVS